MKFRRVDVSVSSVLKVIGVVLAVLFLYFIRDILFQLYIAALIVFIIDPLVKRIQKFKVPRGIGVLIVYVSIIALFSYSITSIVPVVTSQTQNFVSKSPMYLSNLGINDQISSQISTQILDQIGGLPSQVVRFGLGIFSNLIEVITVLTFSYYLLVIRDQIPGKVGNLFGKKIGEEVRGVTDELETKLGGWARGQLALMIIVGVFTYIGLYLIGIPYALPLAIIAGILEAVPLVGPFLAAIPAVIVGFSISPLTGVATTSLAFLIQQMENYIFVPKVMEKSVGITPIATLIALSLGARLAGVAGILVSVPTMIVLLVFLDRYFLHKLRSKSNLV